MNPEILLSFKKDLATYSPTQLRQLARYYNVDEYTTDLCWILAIKIVDIKMSSKNMYNGLVLQTTIAAGNHNVGILADGSVVEWGDNKYGDSLYTDGLKCVQVSAAANHSICILEDGSAITWGPNFEHGGWLDEQYTTSLNSIPDVGGRRFIQVSTGYAHNVGLLEDGTVIAWGDNTDNQCNIPYTNGRKFIQICAGSMHTVGILDDGSAIAWGISYFGQMDIPDTQGRKFKEINIGNRNDAGILDDGSIVVWGKSTGTSGSAVLNIPKPDRRNFVHVYVSKTIFDQYIVTILDDGSAIKIPLNNITRHEIIQVPNGHDIIQFALSDNSIYILDDGSVHSWGTNRYFFPFRDDIFLLPLTGQLTKSANKGVVHL